MAENVGSNDGDAARLDTNGVNGASKGGRPRTLDSVKRAEICAMLSVGCTFRAAASYVGCSPAAISMLMQRDEEFRQQVGRALAQRELEPLAQLRQAGERSWRAAAWRLERTVKGPYRRGSEDDPTDLERLVAEEVLGQKLGETTVAARERIEAEREELERTVDELEEEPEDEEWVDGDVMSDE